MEIKKIASVQKTDKMILFALSMNNTTALDKLEVKVFKTENIKFKKENAEKCIINFIKENADKALSNDLLNETNRIAEKTKRGPANFIIISNDASIDLDFNIDVLRTEFLSENEIILGYKNSEESIVTVDAGISIYEDVDDIYMGFIPETIKNYFTYLKRK
jgi:hypothetical protein